MRHTWKTICRSAAAILGPAALLASPPAVQSAVAQPVETTDPDQWIDADLAENPGNGSPYGDDTPSVPPPPPPAPPESTTVPAAQPEVGDWDADGAAMAGQAAGQNGVRVAPEWSDPVPTDASEAATVAARDPSAIPGDTYKEDDLIGAAEGVFGKGAEGVARMIQKLLADQGEPNGYIVGREAGGAFFVGARYGSGTLFHKVEGQMPVYWTGPSIGFDVGANAANTFVLVYNLYDTDELYERFPAGEGQAYAIGGLNASYLRKGDVVMIPIRVGAGLRLGVNAGYMKFSRKQRWLPF
ncbi:hypothetical protein HME9302_00260 [Alteripontixanthobacter maritimus]|uniref:DUF1134 domain-containing protein n=1 Tax=Alteripontixanthobacter maritimus TaxID=2161824 RepID=A0A369Q2F4_9SPHN|nr:DUF1134 domain-containing protein [Alteripontixanthobacter maritimus]RDC59081.1 hypothetical protein HME9302_00260 [Alteripontixanthobacter maritimus]